MIRAFILVPLLALAGCASTPVIAPPQIVTVTKVQYVPLPVSDLMPCVAPMVSIRTGADVIAAWQGALAALSVCNEQITNLRTISGQVKP